MAADIRWHLELGGEVVARIADANTYEYPWTYGTLVDSPEFERFRPYFTDPEGWADDDPAMEALCGEVQHRGWFVLRDLKTGELHRGFLFNQDEELVWFRIG